MTLLNTVNVGGVNYRYLGAVPVGTCATPAGTQLKETAFDDSFSVEAGSIVAVKFTYANTYGDGSSTYPSIKVGNNNYPMRVASSGGYAKNGDWGNSALLLLLFDGTSMYII